MAKDKNGDVIKPGEFVTHDGKRCKVLAAGQSSAAGIVNTVLELDDESKHTFAVCSGETIKESGVSPTPTSRKTLSREQSKPD